MDRRSGEETEFERVLGAPSLDNDGIFDCDGVIVVVWDDLKSKEDGSFLSL